jgi:CheY-like chemotaxis protein
MAARKAGAPVEILLVEDNPADVRLTQEALKEGKVYNNLHWAKDGVEALEFLHRKGKHAARRARHHPARPQPAEEGRPRGAAGHQERREAEAHPGGDPHHLQGRGDVLRSYNLHANCYVTKPVDLEKFIVVVKSIDMFWLTIVTLPNGK